MMVGARVGAWSGKQLPYDAEVEYLESTGTQWIDTGDVCSGSLGIEIDISVLELNDTTYPQFFGCYEPTTLVAWGGWSNSEREYSVGTSTSILNIDNPPIPFRSVNSINYLSDGLISIESVELNLNQKDVFRYGNELDNLKVILFGGGNKNGVTSYDGKCRIYRAKITDGMSVIHDFIPVLKDGVGYMYDRVSGQLFGNAGTGAFIIGPDKTT